MLTLAGIVNAIGITFFLNPVKLYDSGISGTSMLLAQITPEYLTLSIFLLILNIPLFLYGFKKQGKAYSAFVLSVYYRLADNDEIVKENNNVNAAQIAMMKQSGGR